MASIDDLLRDGDEDEPSGTPPRARSRTRRWIGGILVVAVLSAATIGGLRIAGVAVSPLLVVVGFAALQVLRFAVGEVLPPSLPRAGTRRGPTVGEGRYDWQETDGLRIAVREWERQLEWSQSDAAKFSRHVLPTLAELTDERLRQRRGITRASDPQRARELLGEPLWRLLAGPGRRAPKPRDLAEHVARMEQL